MITVIPSPIVMLLLHPTVTDVCTLIAHVTSAFSCGKYRNAAFLCAVFVLHFCPSKRTKKEFANENTGIVLYKKERVPECMNSFILSPKITTYFCPRQRRARSFTFLQSFFDRACRHSRILWREKLFRKWNKKPKRINKVHKIYSK